MQILWNKDNLWNKAKNINILYNNNISIPETYIINNNNISDCNFTFLKKNKQYILRPSFLNEDNSKFSLAWFYKSIYPVQKNEIIDIFRNKNYTQLFKGEMKDLKSIIIQEFIKSNIYWVYFTKNPNNIFEKWFYEIWNKNNSITSWKIYNNIKLTFIQWKELEILWNKLENIFNYPQDIEFCIKNSIIIILQTRNITTWNNTIYSFKKIKKINWIYETLDSDELWEKQDYFSYEVLKNLFQIIYINWNIYFKKTLFPIYLFKTFEYITNNNLKLFIKNYKIYFKKKIIFNLIRIFSFQRLNKLVLIDLFKNYDYSFLLNKKSNLDLNFEYKNINHITREFLKTEKLKNNAFLYLEKYKKNFKYSNFIWEDNYNLDKKLFFLNWKLIKITNETDNFIYKWEIKWIITTLESFDKTKKNQVLIIENLDFNIYDKLENLSWIIIKYWNLLSHNSIILREYKIPSIINYDWFEKLKIWEKIIV